MVRKVQKIQAVNPDGETAYFHPQSWAAMPVDENGLRFGWQKVSVEQKSEKPIAPATPAPGRRRANVNED